MVKKGRDDLSLFTNKLNAMTEEFQQRQSVFSIVKNLRNESKWWKCSIGKAHKAQLIEQALTNLGSFDSVLKTICDPILELYKALNHQRLSHYRISFFNGIEHIDKANSFIKVTSETEGLQPFRYL